MKALFTWALDANTGIIINLFKQNVDPIHMWYEATMIIS